MTEVQTEQGVQARKIGNVEGLGDIYRIDALPLDRQITVCEAVGIGHPYLPDVSEAARIRLAGVSDNWTRTSIVPVAVKGARTMLTKSPLLMNLIMAGLAVKAHRRGEYLEIPGIYDVVRQIAEQESGKEPEDRTALAVSQEGDFNLTPESEVARFLFERANSAYFGNKTNGTIPFFNLSTDSMGGVANYLWFSYPQYRSNLDCRCGDLYNDGDAFGVRRVSSGEASAENSGYSLTEIARAHSTTIPAVLKDIGLGALGELVTRPLAKGLMEKLRGQ
ncbi:MAG TPA: hypothetical protein VJK07_04275 [Candidatus Nanoarchaeia archaeon]|nr:hypothetical protein [Candidatus Nanoarchaeia archaeon]